MGIRSSEEFKEKADRLDAVAKELLSIANDEIITFVIPQESVRVSVDGVADGLLGLARRLRESAGWLASKESPGSTDAPDSSE